MKHFVIVCNGLTDQPVAGKDNQTPLQLARTPNLDRLTREGRGGPVHTIPESLPASGDVAYLGLLGFDPQTHHAGAAWFDALALGVEPGEGEVPLCCDLVSLQSSHNDMVMRDTTAGGLTDAEAEVLLEALREGVVDAENRPVAFHRGRGHHHLMILKSPSIPGRLHPPHELVGEGVREYLPTQDEYKDLIYIINQAQIVLHNHGFNRQRRHSGGIPANSIWLWGNGPRPELTPFAGRYAGNAALVSPDSLFRGMAKAAGWATLSVDGPAGRPATEAALGQLAEREAVYLHAAGPEEASMHGQIEDKILAIEDFDRDVMGPVLLALEGRKDVKILLVVSHFCSAVLMKYGKDPVPFVVWPAGKAAGPLDRFDEGIVSSGPARFGDSVSLMDAFFKDEL